ncbi:unnamed protein product [Amoebophrya sp. A25]|nr:unnamed protein product [Amoebophrya sp. A25]|eukprot:GSA25T00007035001.1
MNVVPHERDLFVQSVSGTSESSYGQELQENENLSNYNSFISYTHGATSSMSSTSRGCEASSTLSSSSSTSYNSLPSLLCAVSFALDFAVRTNQREASTRKFLADVDGILAKMRTELHSRLANVFWVRRVSALQKEIFQLEVDCQKLIYDLNTLSENTDVEDLLWETGEAEILYEDCVRHFDVPSRIGKLKSEAVMMTETCRTHNEHVRHGHASQLEAWIIYLISLEIFLFVGEHTRFFCLDLDLSWLSWGQMFSTKTSESSARIEDADHHRSVVSV